MTHRSPVRPTVHPDPMGSPAMLIEETLARSRMREAQQAAQDYRRGRQLTAGRGWQRLSRWSARRAQLARAAR